MIDIKIDVSQCCWAIFWLFVIVSMLNTWVKGLTWIINRWFMPGPSKLSRGGLVEPEEADDDEP